MKINLIRVLFIIFLLNPQTENLVLNANPATEVNKTATKKEESSKPEKFNNTTLVFISLSAVAFGLFIVLFIRSQNKKKKGVTKG